MQAIDLSSFPYESDDKTAQQRHKAMTWVQHLKHVFNMP
jgi:hypothetical protein